MTSLSSQERTVIQTLLELNYSVADITKIKSWGYIPKYSLERGIREYLSQIER